MLSLYKYLLTCAFFALSLSGVTHAQNPVWVQGPGTFSCGKYLELRATKSDSQDAILASWAWGYIAGFDMEANTPTKAGPPDMPSTLAFIDKHCRDKPLDNVVLATIALIRDLGGKRNLR